MVAEGHVDEHINGDVVFPVRTLHMMRRIECPECAGQAWHHYLVAALLV